MESTKNSPVKTVLIIAIALMVVHVTNGGRWALYAAIIIGIAGLFDKLSVAIDFAWMRLAYYMGMLFPPVVMAIVFYFILFPVAILARLFGKKDPLMLRKGYRSTFVKTNRSFDKSGFEKTW